GLHARNIRQLNETVGRDASAKAPALRLAFLEESEFSPPHRVKKKIVRPPVQRFRGTRKLATKSLQLGHVHARECARADRRTQSEWTHAQSAARIATPPSAGTITPHNTEKYNDSPSEASQAITTRPTTNRTSLA